METNPYQSPKPEAAAGPRDGGAYVTAREFCERRRRRLSIAMIFPAPWFLLTGAVLPALFGVSVPLLVLLFAGMAVWGVVFYREERRWACPFCGAKLNRVLPTRWYAKFPKLVHYFACCGRGLEELVTEEDRRA
jgi:hypothetical protein